VPVKDSGFSLACDALIMRSGSGPLRLPWSWRKRGRTARAGTALDTPTRGIFAAGISSRGEDDHRCIAQAGSPRSSIDRYLGGEGRIDRKCARKILSTARDKPIGTPGCSRDGSRRRNG